METRREFLKKATTACGVAAFGKPLSALALDTNVRLLGMLSDVNTTDIVDAIKLGCRTMGSIFNADDNDLPFFGSIVGTESILAFSDAFSEAHIPGRHLNALLSAEHALGYPIPEDTVSKHAKAAFFSYSGAFPLPLNRDRIGGELNRFLPHNLREGFHALYALARYRNSSRARETAERSIAFILEHWSPEHGWNKQLFEEKGIALLEWTGPFISGIARAIGPLVKYYRTTSSPKALELIAKLRDKAVDGYFLEAGDFDWIRHGLHTHSVTCTMSSLAQLADLTRDALLMQRVKAFFDNGLKRIADEIGWCIENAGPHANPDRGESNNTGDILETALILGKWGYTDYFDFAERILRAHLLPSQLRDISFIQEPENPNNEDGKTNVARRHVGAFGFPAPYGHKPTGVDNPSFNMDIVGGAVGSLSEAYLAIYDSAEDGHRVNLLFDYESDVIRIGSPYTHDGLHITLRKEGPLRVRLPNWVDTKTLSVRGATALPSPQNGYLVIPAAPVGTPIKIGFELSEHDVVLRHRTRNIRVRFAGDRVVGMDNFGTDLTYFPPYMG